MNPPGIESNIAGRATKSITPAAAVWLKWNSLIMAGIRGGAACIENRNVKPASKTMASISQRLPDIVQNSLPNIAKLASL
jgi:hypothetical protein